MGITPRKITFGLIIMSLCLGFVITSLLSGQVVSYSEEIQLNQQGYWGEFISPGIQRCTLVTDPANNVTIQVHLGFFYSDPGDGVNFQLAPGESRMVDLISLSHLKNPSYSIYEIMLSFNFPSSPLSPQLTLTVTILTASLKGYFSNWMNTSTWEGLLVLVFTLLISGPISIIRVLWNKQHIKTVFVGSTCVLWAIFLTHRFSFIRAYSLYCLSLLPLILSIGFSGLILLFLGFSKASPSTDLIIASNHHRSH
ncbi:MAG: hypothetical protein ACFFFH_02615 [Candidatus Thorarchaeota archaeon]